MCDKVKQWSNVLSVHNTSFYWPKGYLSDFQIQEMENRTRFLSLEIEKLASRDMFKESACDWSPK